jgi:hypothetical protein
MLGAIGLSSVNSAVQIAGEQPALICVTINAVKRAKSGWQAGRGRRSSAAAVRPPQLGGRACNNLGRDRSSC